MSTRDVGCRYPKIGEMDFSGSKNPIIRLIQFRELLRTGDTAVMSSVNFDLIRYPAYEYPYDAEMEVFRQQLGMPLHDAVIVTGTRSEPGGEAWFEAKHRPGLEYDAEVVHAAVLLLLRRFVSWIEKDEDPEQQPRPKEKH